MTATTTTADAAREPDPPAEPAGPARRGGRAVRWGEGYALVLMLLAVVVVFSVLPGTGPIFASLANWRSIMANLAVVTVVALALLVPLVAGNLDFTVGATAGVASVATATAMSDLSLPLGVGLVLGMLVGAVVGCVNGVVVAVLRVSSFISTLGLSILLGGLVQWYTGGVDIVGGIDPRLTDFGSGSLAGVPQPFVLTVVVTAACWFLLASTPYGRRLRAVGSNARAATLVGVDVRRVVFASFVVSGTLAGLAGVLLVARNGGAVSGAGDALLFPAFAAVFLGATTIDPGRYNAPGTFVGVLFVAVAVSGLTLSGAASWVPDVFNGGVLVLAVVVSTLLSRQRRRGP